MTQRKTKGKAKMAKGSGTANYKQRPSASDAKLDHKPKKRPKSAGPKATANQ